MEVSSRGEDKPLQGKRICLVRETRVSHGSRIPRQIRLLQEAGAEVVIVTANPDPADKPAGVSYFVSPLETSDVMCPMVIPASSARLRPVRIASNLTRNAIRWTLTRVAQWRANTHSRERVMRRLAPSFDLFWVVDYPGLPSTMEYAKRFGNGRVLYDTIDLVPEFDYDHVPESLRTARLEGEREHIGKLAGFVTACESYARYYDERYGDVEGYRSPTVYGNAPDTTVNVPGDRIGALRMLFMGNLTYDRPIYELIDAMSLVESDVTLTFQGENRLGQGLHDRVRESGLMSNVRIEAACPVEDVVAVASRHDVGIVALEGRNENERRAETTKVYTYMAAGLAVLGSDLPGIARVVRAAGNGVLVSGLAPEDWARAIDGLAALDAGELEAMRSRSLDFARASRPSMSDACWVDSVARAVGE